MYGCSKLRLFVCVQTDGRVSNYVHLRQESNRRPFWVRVRIRCNGQMVNVVGLVSFSTLIVM